MRYFRRQEFYRTREPVWHFRPASEAIHQILALREKLGVHEWEATPPGAGLAFFCRNCHRWSNRSQEPHARRLLEVGECNHYIDPRNGECYCSYTKFDKAALLKRRDDAGCDRREEEEDEDSEEEEDEEEEPQDPFLLDWDEQGNPVIRADNMENPIVPAAQKTSKGVHERRFLSQALTVMGPARPQSLPCGGEPLRELDMFGMWYRLKRNFYGLCVFCGNLTVVEQRKLTTFGLSCLNHDEALPPQPHHPLQLARTHVCAACGTHDDAFLAGQIIRVYDEHYHTFEARARISVFHSPPGSQIPLCKVHMSALARLIPTTQIGYKGASNVYPVALVAVLEALKAYSDRQRGAPRSVARPAPAPTRNTPWGRLERLVTASAAPPELVLVFMRGERELTAVDLALLTAAEQAHAAAPTPRE